MSQSHHTAVTLRGLKHLKHRDRAISPYFQPLLFVTICYISMDILVLPKISTRRSPPRSPGTPGTSRSSMSRGAMTPMSRRIGTPASRLGTGQSTVRSDMSRVTKEDKRAAMMGYVDLNKSVSADGTVSYREEFCGACGIIHSQPDLLHVYTSCKSCHCVLREPAELRKLYYDVPPSAPLEILFATYGDPIDPDFALDVTETCEKLVNSFTGSDRIAFKPALPADRIFGVDPYPGHNKQLRMRYRAGGTHGTLALDFDRDNKIPVPFLMLVPKTRYLRVFSAIYGHPKGATNTGRMSFDVLELVQALIDQNGGSYLSISSYTPLERLFGDPCPGYSKDLRIQYEVRSRGGSVNYAEVRGHLRKRIYISASPTVAPIIYVQTATYGITPTARRDHLDSIQKKLKKIAFMEHRIREGFRVPPDDMKLFKTKKALVEEKELFNRLPTNFVDISVKMQILADKGGIKLFLDKDSFDPNAVFGNTSPGTPKILELLLDCQGHDSERTTDSTEMMDTGYSRNFITVKKGRFNIIVDDDPETGAGIMRESLDFHTDVAQPVILITRATYGELHGNDTSKIIDVTNDIQAQVDGRTLTIEREVNLNKLFHWDPSPGKRKHLNIQYLTKGFTGNVRVREKNDCLVAGVELGYPLRAPPDDDDFVIN